jgi:hypothetical protein
LSQTGTVKFYFGKKPGRKLKNGWRGREGNYAIEPIVISGKHKHSFYKIYFVQGIACGINGVEHISAIFQLFQVAKHRDVPALGHIPRNDPYKAAIMVVQPYNCMRWVLADCLHYDIARKWIRARIYCHPFRIMYFDNSKCTEAGRNQLSQIFYALDQFYFKLLAIKILQPISGSPASELVD